MIVFIKDEALKMLKKIPSSDAQKIRKKFILLQKNPLLDKPLRGNHAGQYTLHAWPLRIIYTFNPKTQIMEIITVDYRGNVYRK